MGDSFSFMPAGAGVLKNFALLLRQIFIYFLHSCLSLKKKNFFKLTANFKIMLNVVLIFSSVHIQCLESVQNQSTHSM